MPGQFSRAYGKLLGLGTPNSRLNFSHSSIHRGIIILASCWNFNDLGLDIFGDFNHLDLTITPSG